MTIYVGNGLAFEANAETGETGLTGTLAVRIDDNDGNTVFGPTTANITEHDTTGLYSWNAAAAPASLGQYAVVWSMDGTFDEDSVLTEDLVVVTATAGPLPPIPPPSEGGLVGGPCTAWVTAADVAACCGVETTDETIFEFVADEASQLLYQLSGRQFSGLCGPRTVRPPCDSCWCGYQILSRGYVIGPWDYGYPLMLCDQCLISCSPSRVKLAGYPVREITEVKINGDILDPSEYTIWNNRYLTRLDDAAWPVAQDLTLADTEESTFSISYTYGAGIPPLAAAAAAQLACELYQACAGNTTNCALPQGTTRVTRQGVVIERLAFTSWAFRDRTWRTGLPLVDGFLSAYNPAGNKRRPVFWSPGKRQYAQEMG